MRLARHYYSPDHQQRPLSDLSFIGAWSRSDGDPNTDSGTVFISKDGIESGNLLVHETWEEHKERMEQKGWYFHEPYGHGCHTDDVILAIMIL